MTEINSNMAYYPTSPSAAKKKKIGATIAGSLIGMNAYYLPIKKDVFVQRAFDITKDEANAKIATLANIAKEVEQDKVSTESKMILQEMGLNEDLKEITRKCIELDKEVSDPAKVKSLKDSFSKNFKNYKKDVSLMDNTCASAFKEIKRSKFWWGAGIGAAVGLALSLIGSKD